MERLISSLVGYRFVQADLVDLRCHVFFDGDVQDFGNAEEPHRDRQKIDPHHQFIPAEGEAREAVHRIDADGADEQSQGDHDRPFEGGLSGKIGQQDEGENHEGEVFRRTEGEGGIPQERRKELEAQNPQRSGDEGADGHQRQGCPGPPFLGHLVAVETGHDTRRFTRDIDQDRGGRSSVHGPVPDPRHHDQAGYRAILHGEGKHQGHRHRWP